MTNTNTSLISQEAISKALGQYIEGDTSLINASTNATQIIDFVGNQAIKDTNSIGLGDSLYYTVTGGRDGIIDFYQTIFDTTNRDTVDAEQFFIEKYEINTAKSALNARSTEMGVSVAEFSQGVQVRDLQNRIRDLQNGIGANEEALETANAQVVNIDSLYKNSQRSLTAMTGARDNLKNAINAQGLGGNTYGDAIYVGIALIVAYGLTKGIKKGVKNIKEGKTFFGKEDIYTSTEESEEE